MIKICTGYQGFANFETDEILFRNAIILMISYKEELYAYYGHADPLYGDIDPPIGNWIKEFDSMTILPFFS